MAEVQQQRLHELLVQQMTRAVPVAVRVARNPLLEGHTALHVHRVVLNVNKCLMGVQNTVSHLMKIGLRSEWWMAPSQISVSALLSIPFKTELRSLVEHRSVAGAVFSCVSSSII